MEKDDDKWRFRLLIARTLRVTYIFIGEINAFSPNLIFYQSPRWISVLLYRQLNYILITELTRRRELTRLCWIHLGLRVFLKARPKIFRRKIMRETLRNPIGYIINLLL